MVHRTRSAERAGVVWPGFVDALATLLMVFIFLLVVFMLAQYFLNVALSGRDEALLRLNRQISELADLLSLEKQANAELRLNVAQLSAELQGSTAERDELSASLVSVLTERDALDLRLKELADKSAATAAEAEAMRAALAEAEKAIEIDRETIELKLAELASLRQDIVALRAVRADLEGQVSQLASALDQSQGELAQTREETTALRDRTMELEARLSDAAERTALAQKEIEEREIRLNELRLALQQSDEDLTKERELSARTRSQVDLLNQQIAALRQQLARIAEALEVSEREAEEQQVAIADLGRRLNLALAGKVEELQYYRSEFFGRLRDLLGNRPGIRVEGDRFVFQSEVLFASGSAQLEAAGQTQMAQLAATLIDIAQNIPTELKWILRVDGHTDKVPIATAQFPSNWELSTARAISVVRFLIDRGVPPDRLAATGFGEFQPIDPHGDEIGFRRNRRIELKLTTR